MSSIDISSTVLVFLCAQVLRIIQSILQLSQDMTAFSLDMYSAKSPSALLIAMLAWATFRKLETGLMFKHAGVELCFPIPQRL